MTNPFDQPSSEVGSSKRLDEEMRLAEYWKTVKSRRNQLYFYLIIGGMLVESVSLFIGMLLGAENNNKVFLATVGILTFGGLAWLGYRVGNIRCYKCGHKLAMGHFFFLKNVRCRACGFRFNGT